MLPMMYVYYKFIVNGACYKIFEYIFKNIIASQIYTKMEMMNKIVDDMIEKNSMNITLSMA